ANSPYSTASSPLSLHDALPISTRGRHSGSPDGRGLRLRREGPASSGRPPGAHGPVSCSAALHHPFFIRAPRSGLRLEGRLSGNRSEEHTSELQSRSDLVCRLLL